MSSGNVAKFGKSVNDAERDPSNLETTLSNAEGSSAETGQLKREFKERHVSMIAVAGSSLALERVSSGAGPQVC